MKRETTKEKFAENFEKLRASDAAAMVRMYSKGKSLREIGDHMRLSYVTVRRRLIEAKVTLRSIGPRKKICPKKLSELMKLGLTRDAMCKRLKVSHPTLRRAIDALGAENADPQVDA